MVWIECPKCGWEVSDKEPVCVHCSYPLKIIQQRQLDFEQRRHKAKITEIMTTMDSVEEDIRDLENAKKVVDKAKRDIESSIFEKNFNVDKLAKKIFGKKKTEAEIQILNDEIEKLSKELQSVSKDVKLIEKVIAEKNLKRVILKEKLKD